MDGNRMLQHLHLPRRDYDYLLVGSSPGHKLCSTLFQPTLVPWTKDLWRNVENTQNWQFFLMGYVKPCNQYLQNICQKMVMFEQLSDKLLIVLAKNTFDP